MQQYKLPSARLIFTVFNKDRGMQPRARPQVTFFYKYTSAEVAILEIDNKNNSKHICQKMQGTRDQIVQRTKHIANRHQDAVIKAVAKLYNNIAHINNTLDGHMQKAIRNFADRKLLNKQIKTIQKQYEITAVGANPPAKRQRLGLTNNNNKDKLRGPGPAPLTPARRSARRGRPLKTPRRR
jgi:hypothetical protein